MAAHNWNIERGQWKQQKGLYAQLKALVDSGGSFFPRKVFESDTEMDVINKEIELINHYGIDNLFNGVSSKLFGAVTSDKALAVRQAISRARTGMKFSDEHRRNIGLSQKGRVQTPEWIKNNADARRGQKREPYANKLSPEESERLRLAKFKRYYAKHSQDILANLQLQRDAERLQQWQSKATGQPLPSRITPIAHLTPEQRQERKRARERINHAMRKAKATGDQAEIDRLTAERKRLDAGLAEAIVSSLMDGNDEELLAQMGQVAGRPAKLLKSFRAAWADCQGNLKECLSAVLQIAGVRGSQDMAELVSIYLDDIGSDGDVSGMMAELLEQVEKCSLELEPCLDKDTVWALMTLFRETAENIESTAREDVGLPPRYPWHDYSAQPTVESAVDLLLGDEVNTGSGQ